MTCCMPPHGPTATPTLAPGAMNAASTAIECGDANVIATRSRRAHPNETEPDATDAAIPAGGGEPPDRSPSPRQGSRKSSFRFGPHGRGSAGHRIRHAGTILSEGAVASGDHQRAAHPPKGFHLEVQALQGLHGDGRDGIMITGELKSKVDRIWDTMWSGGISNPLSVIEQLTYLLFIKRLDELHTRAEHKAARTGRPIEEPLFTAHQDALRWSRFKELAPEQMFETVRDKVFPFIKSMGRTEDSDGGSTYSHHMQDAIFMMPTARVLANVVDQLDDIDMADRDTKGDLYEYMLGKIATAGQNGQFRTPRHIIRLMVDMTAPTPKDVICDPACGTAGFLVAASEHLVEHHGDRIYKDAQARRRFNEGTFHGYDFDTTMLRIGSMNMLLHGVENPDIRYKDSLAQTNLASAGDDAERYALVLANPPFAGSLDYESTARACSRSSRRRRPSCCSLPCSCACSRPAAAPPSSCPTAYSSGRVRRTRPCAGFWSRSRSSTPSSPCPPASSNPTPVSPPPSCSSPRPTPEAERRLVLRHAGGRLLAGRQAHAAARQQRPCRHPRPLAGTARRSASGRGRTRVSAFPRSRSRATTTTCPSTATRRWSMRRLSTTRRGDPGATGGAGARDREGTWAVGRAVEMISRETIRRGFPIKPLGEVAEFLDSRRRPITTSERIPGPYPYYGANGQQDSVEDYIFDEPLILLAEDGGRFDQPDRGIAYAIEGKTWVNNHAHVLRPRAHAQLRYLVRVLENYDVTPWITGSTRAKLTKAGASKIQIPLPPLAEQKRIARILDAADALRAKRREALAQLDTLIQSTFVDMFGEPVSNLMGWEVQKLADVFWLQEGPGVRNWQFKDPA